VGPSGLTRAKEYTMNACDFMQLDIEDLLLLITRNLASKPKEITIGIVRSERSTIYEIGAATEDIGRLVGRNGHTISAIITITQAIATLRKKRVVVNVNRND
jgi:predicted RNA-binding protein YlqC (UPF0109 family)